MNHSYIKWTINVNSNILDNFYKACAYLHKNCKQNCFYNKSSAFQYIMDKFNQDVNSNKISKQLLMKYVSKTKKDKEIGISIYDYSYLPFLTNCKKFNINRNNMIRILMLKLIDETNSMTR